jgi:integrase
MKRSSKFTPLYTIAKLMGHKSIAMSERYSHLSPDHKKDAINAIAAALKRHKSKVVDINAVDA